MIQKDVALSQMATLREWAEQWERAGGEVDVIAFCLFEAATRIEGIFADAAPQRPPSSPSDEDDARFVICERQYDMPDRSEAVREG